MVENYYSVLEDYNRKSVHLIKNEETLENINENLLVQKKKLNNRIKQLLVSLIYLN
jgi:hypothetical protein